MKFKNLDNDQIIEVKIDDFATIERFKGYPDKFKIVGEFDEKFNKKTDKSNKKK